MTRRICELSTPKLASSIMTFIEYVSGVEFYSYQRRISLRVVESLLLNDGANISVLLSRQSGKSEVMADTALGLTIILPVLARTFPDDERLSPLGQIRIAIYGPNQESTGPIYERIRTKAESERVQAIVSDPSIGMHLVQSRGDSLSWSLGSYVKAKTASDAAFVEGGTFHLILLDEAQKISEAKVNKEISPQRAATNGTMCKIGTAWMSRGGFHTDITTNLRIEKEGGPQNHFEFDYEVCIREKQTTYNKQKREYDLYTEQLAAYQAKIRKDPPDDKLRKDPPNAFHLAYTKFINSEIVRLGGTDNEEFKMNFRLLWQESRQIAITDTEIERAALPEAELLQGSRHGVQVAGLDIAKNDDSTVLTVAEVDLSVPIFEAEVSKHNVPGSVHYVKTIIGILELQGSFEQLQYNAITDFLSGFRVQKLVSDSTGMGDPVTERVSVLVSAFGIEVEPYTYSHVSKDALWKYYLQEFKARRVLYPAGPHTRETTTYKRFVEQHGDLSREYRGSYLTCYAGSSGGHDDYPNSAALATWAAKGIVGKAIVPTVQVTSSGIVSGSRRTHSVSSRADRYRSRR